MSQPRGKLVKRKVSPPRRGGGDDEDNRRPREQQHRFSGERRSKEQQDMREENVIDAKGKARMRTPPLRKRKVVEVMSDSCSEEDRGEDRSLDRTHKQRAWSSGKGSPKHHDDEDYDAADTGRRGKRILKSSPRVYKEDGTLLKPVELDVQGIPHGSMMSGLSTDVKKYAKGLDPTCSWDAQPASEKYRFFRRLYSDWEMQGQSKKVSEKWIAPIITKVLITTRFRLNGLIDEDSRRPPDVTPEQWETLVTRRKSEAGVQKSEHMRAISKGKGSKALQLRAIERDAIIKLSILHKRAPYASEIASEVGRECQRQEEEKIRGSADRASDALDMRTRIADMEGSVVRLEDKMDASHRRVEDMVRHLITSLSPNVPVSLPMGAQGSLPTPVQDSTAARTISSVLPSTDECVAVPAVSQTEQVFVGKTVDDDGGEFVHNLFPQPSPDGRLPVLSTEEGLHPLSAGDGHPSLNEFVTNGGDTNRVDDPNVYATVDPEADSYILDDVEAAEEAVHLDKEVNGVGGDSGGRGRRLVKNLQSLKTAKLVAASRTTKSGTTKAIPVSKGQVPTTKQFSQPKKMELSKKK